MDNWVTFILINVVLALIVGVLGNMISPFVLSGIAKSIFSSRMKKIESIKRDYYVIKTFNENMLKLIQITVMGVAVGVLVALVAIGAFLVSWILFVIDPTNKTAVLLIAYIGMAVVFLFIGGVFRVTIKPFLQISKFDQFKEETIKKLKKLGATLDDLDKEESETNPESGG